MALLLRRAAVQLVDDIRHRGGRAWLYRETDGGHSQRSAADVLEFSATVLAFAADLATKE